MNPGGLQQFDLDVYESGYRTNNPADPIVGLDIHATVGVSIKWNATGTGLDPNGIDTSDPDKNGVTYDLPFWAGPGHGPFDIFQQGIVDVKKIGTVSWSVTTKTLCLTEVDATGAQTRIAVTPTVILVRTTTLTGAGSSTDIADKSSPSPIYGNWVKRQPAGAA